MNFLDRIGLKKERPLEPEWKKLALELYNSIRPKDAFCNNPNHFDLFTVAITRLSGVSKYTTMSQENKYYCIKELSSLYGININLSLRLAYKILSQTQEKKHDDRLLGLD